MTHNIVDRKHIVKCVYNSLNAIGIRKPFVIPRKK